MSNALFAFLRSFFKRSPPVDVAPSPPSAPNPSLLDAPIIDVAPPSIVAQAQEAASYTQVVGERLAVAKASFRTGRHTFDYGIQWGDEPLIPVFHEEGEPDTARHDFVRGIPLPKIKKKEEPTP